MKTLLYNILEELNTYNRKKSTLLDSYISERLDKSLSTYQNDISKSLEYLIYKDNSKVLKNLNKG